MNKLEKINVITYQIVGENKYLMDALLRIKQQGITKVIVNLKDEIGSLANKKTGDIILGIKDIIPVYSLTKHYSQIIYQKPKFIIEKKYSDFNDGCNIRDYIDVQCSSPERNMVLERLDSTDFLEEEVLSLYDIITVFSLLYSLAHEVGHIIYDDESKSQICSEKEADSFAFNSIKLMKKNEAIDIPRFLGAFLGIAHVFIGRTQKEEIDDINHPHSIERIYALLDSLELEENSMFWGLAYNMVLKWHQKYGMPIDWENPLSHTYKDKMVDAFNYYKKV